MSKEVNNPSTNSLDGAHNLEPALGATLAGNFYFIEIQDFVFEVEIQLAGEKTSQVLMDEEVRRVPPRVLPQMVFERSNRLAIAVLAPLRV